MPLGLRCAATGTSDCKGCGRTDGAGCCAAGDSTSEAAAAIEARCGASKSVATSSPATSRCTFAVEAPSAVSVFTCETAVGIGTRVATSPPAASGIASSVEAPSPVLARRDTRLRFQSRRMRTRRMAAPPTPPPRTPPRELALGVGEREGGGGESVVPGSGAATTAIVGVDSTVNPAGIRSAAADASARAGARLLWAASAAALDADSMVISSRTEAADTRRETRL